MLWLMKKCSDWTAELTQGTVSVRMTASARTLMDSKSYIVGIRNSSSSSNSFNLIIKLWILFIQFLAIGILLLCIIYFLTHINQMETVTCSVSNVVWVTLSIQWVYSGVLQMMLLINWYIKGYPNMQLPVSSTSNVMPVLNRSGSAY